MQDPLSPKAIRISRYSYRLNDNDSSSSEDELLSKSIKTDKQTISCTNNQILTHIDLIDEKIKAEINKKENENAER